MPLKARRKFPRKKYAVDRALQEVELTAAIRALEKFNEEMALVVEHLRQKVPPESIDTDWWLDSALRVRFTEASDRMYDVVDVNPWIIGALCPISELAELADRNIYTARNRIYRAIKLGKIQPRYTNEDGVMYFDPDEAWDIIEPPLRRGRRKKGEE